MGGIVTRESDGFTIGVYDERGLYQARGVVCPEDETEADMREQGYVPLLERFPQVKAGEGIDAEEDFRYLYVHRKPGSPGAASPEPGPNRHLTRGGNHVSHPQV